MAPFVNGAPWSFGSLGDSTDAEVLIHVPGEHRDRNSARHGRSREVWPMRPRWPIVRSGLSACTHRPVFTPHSMKYRGVSVHTTPALFGSGYECASGDPPAGPLPPRCHQSLPQAATKAPRKPLARPLTPRHFCVGQTRKTQKFDRFFDATCSTIRRTLPVPPLLPLGFGERLTSLAVKYIVYRCRTRQSKNKYNKTWSLLY